VSHHAKTPSAGSNTGQGASLGSFLRGAFAIRGGSAGSDGSGARSFSAVPAEHLKLILALALAIAALLALAAPMQALAAPPAVTTEPASGVAYTTATAHGNVDPEGEAIFYRFQFVTDEQFAINEWEEPGAVGEGFIEAGEGPRPVEAELSELRPGTKYHLRLVGETPGGERSESVAPNFTTKAVASPTVSIEPVTAITGATATFGGHVAPNAPGPAPQDPAFNTLWHFVCNPECETVEEEITGDNDDHVVSKGVTGLQANTNYEVHLAARNAGGTSESAIETFKTPTVPPSVLAQSVESVGTDSASLNATINPENDSTTYHFEYGPTTAYGGTTAESGPLPIKEFHEPTSVNGKVANLSMGTVYHWRVVATNSAGTTLGPDRTFVTFDTPAAAAGCGNEALRYGAGRSLPDCRAYEQVTPIDKNGMIPLVAPGYDQAAIGGDGVTYLTLSGLPGDAGAQDYPVHIARRTGEGWVSAGLQPPAQLGQIAEVLGWTPDLHLSFASFRPFSAGQGIFALETATGVGQMLLPNLGVSAKSSIFMAGSSSDGRYLLFETSIAIPGVSGAIPGQTNLYLADRFNGKIVLAGVMNDGGAPAEGAHAGAYDWWNSSLENGGTSALYYLSDLHALSTDGATVYFTDGSAGRLYARTSPSTAQSEVVAGHCTEPSKGCTIEVSESHKTNGSGPGGTDPLGPQPAAFMAATADGSAVLFTSSEKLTNGATTGPSDQGTDLYRYSWSTQQLTDLVPDTLDPNGAEVRGVLGSSDDGTYVYFAANGVLAPGATPGNCPSGYHVGGKCNLYVLHEADGQRSIQYLAQLDSRNEQLGDANDWRPFVGVSLPDQSRSSRVSADGRVLLFRSIEPLTGYPNDGVPEYFRYDHDSGNIICVSCNPSGAAPRGPAQLQASLQANGPFQPQAFLPRNLSADGNRVFFRSPDALVSADTNQAPDVYEWEASGSGSCQAAANGCLFLISDGRAAGGSDFVDASESGNDVFFRTASQLVLQDRDQIADLYDARVGGGLAAQASSESAPPCIGESCRGTVLTSPSIPSSGTSAFAGPGNKKYRKTQKKRSHKKKHHKKTHQAKHRHMHRTGKADK
jgi:hypothetical protein